MGSLFGTFDDEVVIFLQSFSPSLDSFFGLITTFGDEILLMALIIVVYACVDKKVALRIAFLLTIGGVAYTALKGLFGYLRPYQSNPDIRGIKDALGSVTDGYSFPSGHATNAGMFWTFLGVNFRNKILWVISGFFLLMIPLSRNYLGVHYPSDVLVGVLIGVGLALILYWYSPRVEAYLGAIPDVYLFVGSALVGLIVLVIGTGLTAVAGNDIKLANPSDYVGLFVGLSWGVLLERRYVGFETDHYISSKPVIWSYRVFVGVFVAVFGYILPKVLVGDISDVVVEIVWDVVRRITLAMVLVFLVPLIYVKVEEVLEKRMTKQG